MATSSLKLTSFSLSLFVMSTLLMVGMARAQTPGGTDQTSAKKPATPSTGSLKSAVIDAKKRGLLLPAELHIHHLHGQHTNYEPHAGPELESVVPIPVSAPPEQPSTIGPDLAPAEPAYKYVGNSFSGKFHRPSCPFARAMNPNHVVHFRFRKDAIEHGQQPCRYCLPPDWTNVRAVLIPKPEKGAN